MEIRKVSTKEEQNDAFYVRMNVFVREQNVPEDEEIDSFDETAIHFVGYLNDEPVAASRLRFVDKFGKLERICVMKSHRGMHYGKKLMEVMEQAVKDEGYHWAKLNAQTHAEGFYESTGYQTISGTFMDAGIPHITMIKDLKRTV